MHLPAREGMPSEQLATVPGVFPAVAVAEAPNERQPAVDLAVIVPAYNEIGGIERTLVALREALDTIDCSSEIIVVDDGSDDGTGALAEACGVRVVLHSANQGYGAALKTGILSTSARLVAIIDADSTYPAASLPRLYAALSRADMAVGARRLTSNGIAWIRRPGKWLLNRFASYLAGRHIPDLNSGLRIIRRSAALRYLHLLPSGFSFTSTITLALLANGHPVIYEPIAYTKRVGRSKIRASHFGSFMLLVVRAIVLFNPLKVFLPLGGVLFVLGVLKLIEDIVLWNLSETAVMAFLAAIIVWSVGLLADMIARLQMQAPPGRG
jgi:glycosyltransferase involved in cell wall biosynthesis